MSYIKAHTWFSLVPFVPLLLHSLFYWFSNRMYNILDIIIVEIDIICLKWWELDKRSNWKLKRSSLCFAIQVRQSWSQWDLTQTSRILSEIADVLRMVVFTCGDIYIYIWTGDMLSNIQECSKTKLDSSWENCWEVWLNRVDSENII